MAYRSFTLLSAALLTGLLSCGPLPVDSGKPRAPLSAADIEGTLRGAPLLSQQVPDTQGHWPLNEGGTRDMYSFGTRNVTFDYAPDRQLTTFSYLSPGPALTPSDWKLLSPLLSAAAVPPELIRSLSGPILPCSNDSAIQDSSGRRANNDEFEVSQCLFINDVTSQRTLLTAANRLQLPSATPVRSHKELSGPLALHAGRLPLPSTQQHWAAPNNVRVDQYEFQFSAPLTVMMASDESGPLSLSLLQEGHFTPSAAALTEQLIRTFTSLSPEAAFPAFERIIASPCDGPEGLSSNVVTLDGHALSGCHDLVTVFGISLPSGSQGDALHEGPR